MFLNITITRQTIIEDYLFITKCLHSSVTNSSLFGMGQQKAGKVSDTKMKQLEEQFATNVIKWEQFTI